jgi:hypothetical protein
VKAGRSLFDYANYNRFQKNLASGQPNNWHCGAGCRYLYICEDGLVHWCSQQRGRPGIPLEEYGPDDLRREYHRVKGCAPLCTIGCVHRVAQVDELRQNPHAVMLQWFSHSDSGETPHLPLAVRVLMWTFVTNPRSDLFRSAAAHVFGAGRQT